MGLFDCPGDWEKDPEDVYTCYPEFDAEDFFCGYCCAPYVVAKKREGRENWTKCIGFTSIRILFGGFCDPIWADAKPKGNKCCACYGHWFPCFSCYYCNLSASERKKASGESSVLSEADAIKIYRNSQRIVLGFPKTHGPIDCDNVITHCGKTKAFLFTERWAGKKNARRGVIFLATHSIMRKKFGDEEALEWFKWSNTEPVNKLSAAIFPTFFRKKEHSIGGIKI